MTRNRLRFFAPLFLAMPLALPVVACASTGTSQGERSVLTDADSGAVRTVTTGQSVEVRLSAQLGTGFSWTPVAAGGLEVSAPSVTGSTGIPGAAEIQVFKVKVTTKGSHTLTFLYSQPWSGGAKGVKTVTFTITGI